MEKIASYTGRSPASVARDFDRWTERGLEGLADGRAPGNPPRITGEMKAYMEERLSEERTWNATQLAEALKEGFGLVVTPEAVRQHLRSMGYSWKRTRYVPNKPPNPRGRSARPERNWRLSKGGGQRRGPPEVPRRERLLLVLASHAHLDEEGTSSPASGEAAMGLRGARQPDGYALRGRRRP